MLSGKKLKNDHKTSLALRMEEPSNDFIIPRDDPSAATRTMIHAAAVASFGEAEVELNAKLTDCMMSATESRERITAEIIAFGGQLFHAHYLVRNNRIAKDGDSKRVRGEAAREAYKFIKNASNTEQSAARQYMRCYERFGGNTEAIRVFNVGELDILASKKNTDAQIEEMIAAKDADPKMKRDDIRKLIKMIRERDEELVDARAQLENVTSLLQDSKTELFGVEKDQERLKDDLSASRRAHEATKSDLANLDDVFTRRTASMGSLEKEIADANNRIETLERELQGRKPVVQIKEVFVQPDPVAETSDAVVKLNDELAELNRSIQKLKLERDALEQQRDEDRASADATHRVQQTIEQAETAYEVFAGKLASAQLAVQACSDPIQHKARVETLAAMLQKSLSEINAWLCR